MFDTILIISLLFLNLISISVLIGKALLKNDTVIDKIDIVNERISVLSDKIDQLNNRIESQDSKIESVENIVAIMANSQYWIGPDDFAN